MVVRHIKLSELPPRVTPEAKLIDLMNGLRGGRQSTRFDLALLSHFIVGSNFAKEYVREMQDTYKAMLLELDIDKPGRYSEELVRLAKAGMHSLDDQVAALESGSEENPLNRNASDEEANNGGHMHAETRGQSQDPPPIEDASPSS